jgi:hypothetical protein
VGGGGQQAGDNGFLHIATPDQRGRYARDRCRIFLPETSVNRLKNTSLITLCNDGLLAAAPGGSISAFVGLLAGRTEKVATLEEINEVTANAWADRK